MLIILLLLLLYGCFYDPHLRGKKLLYIHNCTDSAVYYEISCLDSLTLDRPSFLFSSYCEDYDRYGNCLRKRISSPSDRVNAYSCRHTGIVADESILRDCEDKQIRFFFIKESTLRDYTWDEICAKQMYEKKLIYTIEDLISNDWAIVYEN